ncbi:hypothetical protein HHI36_012442 [Cryptolaemus montrouzieri]|uniref:SCP domain-containing protein n=1 Tax=Cryptolaemus montrouzieri TaxID=559131 RepID=A0ABD2NF70_9CUCU
MLYDFFKMLVYFFLLQCKSFQLSYIPNFFPYCYNETLCHTECGCIGKLDCFLLEMNENTRQSILFFHNKIRNEKYIPNFQPSGMVLLQYDDQLEEISKCWASTCQNDYSSCFKTPKFDDTSQSIFQISLGNDSPNINLWWQAMDTLLHQIFRLPMEIVSSIPSGKHTNKVYNYAQVMSDRTMYVGCSWSIFYGWLNFVCSYGPRGPRQDEIVYKVGKLCTSCLEGYDCDNGSAFQNLCRPVPDILQFGQQSLLSDSSTVEKNKKVIDPHTEKAVVLDPDVEDDNIEHNGMLIGVMVCLSILSLVSAIGIVIIYTHGHRCR